MAETESKFTVSVDAQGVDSTRKKLEGLEKAGSSAGKSSAQAFANTSANLDKIAASTEKVVQRMERLARAMARVSHAAGPSGRRIGSIADGTQVTGNAPPMSPGRFVAMRGSSVISDLPPSAVVTNPNNYGADQVRNKELYDQMMNDAQDARRSKTLRIPKGASDFGVGMFQSMLPSNLGFLQRGPGAIAQGLGLMAGRSIGGLASIPFAGSGGLSSSLSALGPLALPFQRVMGRAESAMSFQRQQMDMAPLLGSSAINLDPSAQYLVQARKYARDSGLSESAQDSYLSKAASSYRREKINAFGDSPMRLMGADINQGQAFVASLAQNGGNRADQFAPGFAQAAMAARTTTGLDASTLGAFALAGRTGAVAGPGKKDATSLLLDALTQSKSLNLSGADQQNYLQQIAAGIREFQTSGIPLQMESMRDLTAGFTGLGGMSPLAAQRAALGVTAASQQFSPQSGADLVMMQQAGFTGGLDNYLKTRRELRTDSKKFTTSAMSALGMQAKGPSSEVAIDAVTEFMASKGMGSNPLVAKQITEDIRGGMDVNKAFARAMDSGKQTPGVTVASLGKEAAALIPETVVNAAAASNQGVVMGAEASGLVQELDKAANDTASSVARFAGGMKSLVSTIGNISKFVIGDGNATGVRPAN